MIILFWSFLLKIAASSFVYLSTINFNGEESDLHFETLKSAFDYVKQIDEFSTHIITLDTDSDLKINTLEANIYLKEKNLTIQSFYY